MVSASDGQSQWREWAADWGYADTAKKGTVFQLMAKLMSHRIISAYLLLLWTEKVKYSSILKKTQAAINNTSL